MLVLVLVCTTTLKPWMTIALRLRIDASTRRSVQAAGILHTEFHFLRTSGMIYGVEHTRVQSPIQGVLYVHISWRK